jgi:heme A synthase
VTLVLGVPIGVAALHQAGAVLLLTVAVLLYHAVRQPVLGTERGAVLAEAA